VRPLHRLEKAANYRIVAAGFLGFFAVQTLFWLLDIGGGTDPLSAAMAGSLVIGLFFYATDRCPPRRRTPDAGSTAPSSARCRA
jgi:Na+-translocating ferredoxin:NAD+ oxidoreductase RnfD subunit